jgi:hypothetical protein
VQHPQAKRSAAAATCSVPTEDAPREERRLNVQIACFHPATHGPSPLGSKSIDPGDE